MKIFDTYRKNEIICEKNRKRTRRLAWVLAAAITATTISAIAVSSAYDPSTDPIVTLSYAKTTLRDYIESHLASQLGYSSIAALKSAIDSGGGGSVDVSSVISQTKTSILNELGFGSYTSLKSMINSGDKETINQYVQSSILSQLGLSSMASLKSKLGSGASYTLTTADINRIVNNVITDLLDQLDYKSMSSLKLAIDKSGGGSGTQLTYNTILDSLLGDLGYDSVDELKTALEKNAQTPDDSRPDESSQPVTIISGGFVTVELSRGDKFTSNGNCEMFIVTGDIGVIGSFGSAAIADVTAGGVFGTDNILTSGHSYIVPVAENGAAALVCASSHALLYVRGEYETGK